MAVTNTVSRIRLFLLRNVSGSLGTTRWVEVHRTPVRLPGRMVREFWVKVLELIDFQFLKLPPVDLVVSTVPPLFSVLFPSSQDSFRFLLCFSTLMTWFPPSLNIHLYIRTIIQFILFSTHDTTKIMVFFTLCTNSYICLRCDSHCIPSSSSSRPVLGGR